MKYRTKYVGAYHKSIRALTGLALFAFVGLAQSALGQNLVANGAFETSGSDGLPVGWKKGGYGANTRVFSYPVTSWNGSRAVRIDVSGYSNGDAKWYHTDVSVIPGAQYEYEDDYESDTVTYLSARYLMSDNVTYTYVTVGSAPKSSGWWKLGPTKFTAPAGAKSLSVFHLIKSNGRLQIDNVSIKQVGGTPPPPPGGAIVSLNFDDGFQQTYWNADWILENDGNNYKGTFYPVSGRIGAFDNVTESNIREMVTNGHEVGGHTVTHRDLVTLSDNELWHEVNDCKTRLQAITGLPVTSLAYPFGSGAHDDRVRNVVSNAGYECARSTDGGYNNPDGSIDFFALARKGVMRWTTVAEIKGWIDQALADGTWLIIVFHHVDDVNTDDYSTTPSVLAQTCAYLKSKSATVVTTTQGARIMRARAGL